MVAFHRKWSTLNALILMIHHWSQATDGSEDTVRIILIDYRKAFDLIDHNVLIQKVHRLDIPRYIVHWVADFLTNRQQRVKLSEQCFSEWGQVPAGVLEGTKLRPWLFLLMIKDLKIPDVLSWKYVDDTTFAGIVPRGAFSEIQKAADKVVDWSKDQRMPLNEDNCKEIIIDFKENKYSFDPSVINNKDLSVVENAKILGVTISNDLTWNDHVEQAMKKANSIDFVSWSN